MRARGSRRPTAARCSTASIARCSLRSCPIPRVSALALYAALLGQAVRAALRSRSGLKPLAAMLRLAPWRVPADAGIGSAATSSPPRARGRAAWRCFGLRRSRCSSPRSARRRSGSSTGIGIEVVLAEGEACCGSLVHHMGREHEALAFARNNIDAWTREIDGEGLDAISITASGCGTTIKDYGFMLRTDPNYADKARERIGARKDISEYLATLDSARRRAQTDITVAYHSACSMQHGQQIDDVSRRSCSPRPGSIVRDIAEGHLCCGSAGTYNMLQSEIAARLLRAQGRNIEKTAPELVAAGNIGCIDPDRAAARNSGRPHGRTARLGVRRAAAGSCTAGFGGVEAVIIADWKYWMRTMAKKAPKKPRARRPKRPSRDKRQRRKPARPARKPRRGGTSRAEVAGVEGPAAQWGPASTKFSRGGARFPRRAAPQIRRHALRLLAPRRAAEALRCRRTARLPARDQDVPRAAAGRSRRSPQDLPRPPRRDHRARRPQDDRSTRSIPARRCSWPISRTPTRRPGTT